MYHLSHPIRAFMDDLTVTTTSVPGVNWCCCNIQEVRTSCKDLVGTLASRRACLFPPPQKPHMDKARENERDHIIQEEDWADVKEEQMCRTVGLRQQVAWTKRKLQWKITWGTSCKRMSIVSDSSSMPYQAQPISIMWGNHETPICQLCSKRGYVTLESY